MENRDGGVEAAALKKESCIVTSSALGVEVSDTAGLSAGSMSGGLFNTIESGSISSCSTSI